VASGVLLTGLVSEVNASLRFMIEKRWEHFSHQADIGVRGIGASKAEAFEQAALAVTAVLTDLRSVHSRESIEIACEAPDDELLLVDWLNALITESAIRHILWSRFDIQIEGHRLRATAWGEPVEPARHHPAVEVKGATYTELLVRQDPDGTWLAQCVVDV
jgi:tRNA nucleotidyltransferase (CCA-adding enzyme)